MGLEFNVLKADDYPVRAGKVEVARAPSGSYGKDLESPVIFGTRHYDSANDRTLATYHKRGYIELVAPVLNPILAGTDGSLLARVLGWTPAEMRKVLSFDVVLKDGEWISKDELDLECNLSELYLGPQAVEYAVEHFDIHESLLKEMRYILAVFHKKKKYKNAEINGEFVQFNGTPPGDALPIAGNWYYVPPENCRYSYAGWLQYLTKYVYTSDSARITLLVNLDRLNENGRNEGALRLRSMIMRRIMVMPIDMRPSAAHAKISRTTKSYQLVMNQNNFLSLILCGYGSVDSAAAAYSKLIQEVDALLNKHHKYSPSDKSILESIKSKHGHIRDKMLGKRIDYSGRSVITIDPFMSIRDIGIPRDMIPKLYRSAILRSLKNPDLHRYLGTSEERNRACLKRVMECGLLEKIPVVTGRQPTLHKPSMRAFHPVVTNDRSIHLNPLSVSGFNADFDGDQMYTRTPISPEAIEEVNRLMRIENNIFYPKNGECSVMPRQEIIYGLNVCTRPMKPSGNSMSFNSCRELFDAIFRQVINIENPVSCNGISGCAGRVAFMCCVPRNMFSAAEWQEIMETEITSRTIKSIVGKMVNTDTNTAIDYIDRMVELGFRVAATYPPTLNLLDDNEVDYTAEMSAFHEAVHEDTTLYNMGWETEEEYDIAYSTAFSQEVESKVKPRISDDIGGESGFVRMVKSGARGSESNLLQLYGYKGRVVNGQTGGAFRAVIEHSFTDQLTPLEHFITAYGGRASLIQKSLNTADSGYTGRKLWHTTSPFHITTEDCGTEEGMVISKAVLKWYFGKDTAVDDIFLDIVVGRYEAGPGGRFITKDVAQSIMRQNPDNYTVTIRSICTCKNPCCCKCYGTDFSTNKLVLPGSPIGFVAAQSIGEPGTQLNMDAFKKGGLAEDSSTVRLTGFDKLQAYTETKTLRGTPSYDPVAWANGRIVETPKADGTKTVSIEGATGSINISANIRMNTEEPAQKGRGMRLIAGDQDINELIAYGELIDAQRYLCMALYSVYKDEAGVNMKHFEVLAAGMTMHMIITTDQEDLVPGQWHDSIMLLRKQDKPRNLSNTVYVTALKSVKQVQQLRPYALSRIVMENVKSGLASTMLLGLSDPLTYPLNRIMMGLPAWGDRGRDY